MKRITTTLLVAIVLFSGVVTLGAAIQPKFRPFNGGGAGVARYVVTLTEEAGFDDPAALRHELTQIYGAKLDEATASTGGRQFAVTMTYARARLLSSDPRVIEVAEIPLPIAAPTPAASPSTTASHLTPRPSSYGDNGQSGTYTYDGAGNITAIGADTFVYDGVQRLVSSVTRGVQENYTYDAFGNRTSATGAVNCLGQTTCAQTVTVDSNTNHITSINGAAVTYDAAGNISTIAATATTPGAVYSYDALGMMTRATVGTDDRQFLYTADDERIAVRQGVSWTWMIRDQSGKVLREFTSLESGSGPSLAMTNWQWAKDYVWRDGLLLATVSPSGTLHYHLDHLGTPRLVTDANGVKVAEHAYYPFGAEINLTPHENPEEAMKFTGHERDIVAGDGHTLDYMHARYYSATVGRLLSVDPVLGRPNQPQSWNRYAYVQNNPINRTDPTGKCGESANFIGPTRPCVQVAKEVIDKAAFVFATPGLTVMAGFYNDSPKQVASGTAQLALQGAIGGAVSALAKPALAAASSTSLMSRSSIALNLGGEGEVAGASVVNVQAGSIGGNTTMAVRNAVGLARSTGQSVVVASGDALPFQTGAVNTVITNNVPINAGMTYFGQSFTSSEIYRVLSTVGQWIGSSVP